MSNLIKPIFFLLAMIAAFVFTFVQGLSGVEGVAVPLIGSVASVLGIVKWREAFDEFKGYFQSKTIVGALMTSVPILVTIIAVHIAGVKITGWLQYMINGLLMIGGGTFLLGLFDAFYKADPQKRFKQEA